MESVESQIAKWRAYLASAAGVNGHDVEPGAEERGDFIFSCRVYRSERGLSGQPEASWVRKALSEAA